MKPETPTKTDLVHCIAILVSALRRIAALSSFSADRDDILEIANAVLDAVYEQMPEEAQIN